ncbi:hypothetical protein CEXT_205531 [Caerostris extrusa]|uniref:Uncharacterized protein n=1 Tax=Caerostris extrusa TaxID=172846 RepID=A0AAV4QPU2_CAEEX|nr:hypothetical protein CEXT_205531 [Caerostris extrusa]
MKRKEDLFGAEAFYSLKSKKDKNNNYEAETMGGVGESFCIVNAITAPRDNAPRNLKEEVQTLNSSYSSVPLISIFARNILYFHILLPTHSADFQVCLMDSLMDVRDNHILITAYEIGRELKRGSADPKFLPVQCSSHQYLLPEVKANEEAKCNFTYSANHVMGDGRHTQSSLAILDYFSWCCSTLFPFCS